MKITAISMLLIMTVALALAQSKKIEVSSDRFSKVTTVTLNPIEMFKKQDQRLEISLKSWVDPRKPDIKPMVITFISYTKNVQSFGDMQIHCLIDGKPLSLGTADRGNLAQFPGEANTLSTNIELDDLDLIANGKTVEMRLGAIEWVVPESALSVLGDYATTARNHLHK